MGSLSSYPPVVVVHKGPRKNSKIFIEVFKETKVDQIIQVSKRKRNPLIPHNHEILELGVGSKFEEIYKKKYG